MTDKDNMPDEIYVREIYVRKVLGNGYYKHLSAVRPESELKKGRTKYIRADLVTKLKMIITK